MSDTEDHFTDVESDMEPVAAANTDVDTVTIDTAPATDTEDDDEANEHTLTARAASLATAASASLFGLLGLSTVSVPTAADEAGTAVVVPHVTVADADAESLVGPTDAASTIETTSASGHGHETQDESEAEPTTAEGLERSGSQVSSSKSDSAVAQRFLSASSGRAQPSGRPPSYRSWATSKFNRDGKRVTSDGSQAEATTAHAEAESAAPAASTSRLSGMLSWSRPALDGGNSRRNSTTSVATTATGAPDRPKPQRTPSRLSLVLNDFVASSMTSAMTLTDKLSGVDAAALPGNEALTRPKRRVTFREGEPEVADEGPAKKRLAPLLCVFDQLEDQADGLAPVA